MKKRRKRLVKQTYIKIATQRSRIGERLTFFSTVCPPYHCVCTVETFTNILLFYSKHNGYTQRLCISFSNLNFTVQLLSAVLCCDVHEASIRHCYLGSSCTSYCLLLLCGALAYCLLLFLLMYSRCHRDERHIFSNALLCLLAYERKESTTVWLLFNLRDQHN